MNNQIQPHNDLNSLAQKSYPGFKRLNVNGLNSLGVGAVYFGLLIGFFSLIESDMLPEQYPIELKWIVTFIGALFLTIWLALTRGAAKDFEDIVSYGGFSSIESRAVFGQPRRAFRMLELACGASLGYTISFSGRAISTDIPLMYAFANPLDYEFGLAIGVYSILVPLVFIFTGICMIRTTTFLYRQINLFYESASNIQIDLLNPDPLAVFASQPLRVFFGLMGTTAAMAIIFSGSYDLARTAIPIGIPMILFMMILLILVSIPMIKIRSRLREEKTKESLLIRKAITGDRSALSDSRICTTQEEFQMPDLLYYQDRIQSVWEWPLHAHVRRIALYVILPPLAWVLAALVESFVETALQ